MATGETDPLSPLGKLLGIDVFAGLPELPEQSWDEMLDVATDPTTAAVGGVLIPVDEPDDVDLEPHVFTADDLETAPGTELDNDNTDIDISHRDFAELDDLELPDPAAGTDTGYTSPDM
jgi:hypothetical protein